MAKPFDATLNQIIDARPSEWARFLAARVGVPLGDASVLDTDLSTTVQADKVFRIDGPTPALIHLELQSNPRLGIPEDLLRYNVLLGHAHRLPVHSVVMLLRPKANASDLTGHYQRLGADGAAYLEFRYSVIRVWEAGIDDFLVAGTGLAPLAVLTNEAANDLPAAFLRLADQLRDSGVADIVTETLIGSTFVLSGLRYSTTQLSEVYHVMSVSLEDSSTYQWILHRGRVQEAQEVLLELGDAKFGPAEEAVVARLRAIVDRDRLKRMRSRVSNSSDWNDLLSTP